MDALAVIALSVCVAFPLLGLQGVPQGSDAQCHLVRSFEFHEALSRDGQVPPRIGPDLAFGYGYAIHKYYPPAFDAVTFLWRQTIARRQVDAVKLAVGTWLVVGCAGYVLLGRLMGLGRLSGLVGAVAMVSFPVWHQVYERAAWAEFASGATVPWVAAGFVWSLRKDSQRRAGALLSLSVAMTMLAHCVAAVVTGPVFVFVWIVAGLSGSVAWGRLVRMVPWVAIGLAISAWYWLPAIADSSRVQIGRMVDGVYWRGFLGTGEDWKVFWSKAWTWWLFIGGGAVLSWRRICPAGRAFVIAGGILPVLMRLEGSSVLWFGFPFYENLQFPGRFLMLSQLAGAWVVSGLLRGVEAPRLRVVISGSVLLVVVLGCTMWWRPVRDDPNLGEWWANSEYIEGGVVADWGGEYLPRCANGFPEGAQSGVIARGGDVEVLEVHGGFSDRSFRLRVLEESVVEFGRLAYSMWEVWIDEERVRSRCRREEGLLTVEVPSGEHVVRVVIGRTSWELVGLSVSLLGILALPVWLLRATRCPT